MNWLLLILMSGCSSGYTYTIFTQFGGSFPSLYLCAHVLVCVNLNVHAWEVK